MNMPDVRVSRDNLQPAIDLALEKSGKPEMPEWQCLFDYYDLCLPSTLTPLTSQLLQMWSGIGGLKNETFASYRQLPAVLVEGFEIIGGEIARIDRLRAEAQATKHKPKVLPSSKWAQMAKGK